MQLKKRSIHLKYNDLTFTGLAVRGIQGRTPK